MRLDENERAIMLKQTIRRAANTFRFDIHRYSRAEWRWSYDVSDYYPVNPTVRWGYGKPPHPQLWEILNRRRNDYCAIIDQLTEHAEILASVPLESNANSGTPFWKNGWFENFDAAALVGLLVSKAPARYLEIGSGNSTKFARYAVERAKLPTSITSIDPRPRAAVDALCDKVIRERLEDCDLSLFEQLDSGDMIFFDGSHRVFTNSDTTVFFLEVLPRIRRGVVIHVHDIFLPWDYLPDWGQRMYSEQYLLAAMILSPEPLFKILLPNFFACTNSELNAQIKLLLEPIGLIAQGWSFWMEKT